MKRKAQDQYTALLQYEEIHSNLTTDLPWILLKLAFSLLEARQYPQYQSRSYDYYKEN